MVDLDIMVLKSRVNYIRNLNIILNNLVANKMIKL